MHKVHSEFVRQPVTRGARTAGPRVTRYSSSRRRCRARRRRGGSCGGSWTPGRRRTSRGLRRPPRPPPCDAAWGMLGAVLVHPSQRLPVRVAGSLLDTQFDPHSTHPSQTVQGESAGPDRGGGRAPGGGVRPPARARGAARRCAGGAATRETRGTRLLENGVVLMGLRCRVGGQATLSHHPLACATQG